VSSRSSALWQLALARLRSFYREPGAIFWSFGFPIVLAVTLGVAFRNRPPEPVSAAVEVSAERGADGSLRLTEAEEATRDALSKNPDVAVKVLPEAEARAALRTGKVAIAIEVAKGSARTYRFDPTRPESRLARLVVDDALQRADGRADPTAVTEARVTEPGSRYIDFLIPGLVGMGLMQSGLWGIGYVIVEMRMRKLVKRLLATPMRRLDFLLSFVLTRAVFLVVELPILLGFGWLVFDVPLRGSVVLLAGVAALGALSFAGIGLLVASRAENTQTVGGLINLVTLPMFIGSGTFFSSSRFPDALQPLVRSLPLTALNDALRAVMLDGAGARELLSPVAILLAWGAASLSIALFSFRWR
jgi:ABC-2 type transport system permease protein